MRLLFATLLFMAIAGVAFAFAHIFVRRWRPKPQLSSQVAIVTISTMFMFASVLLFTAWGLNPAVIQVNLQQSLNPLRWVPWLLSALNFGVAQAFVFALVRNRVEQARRLGALPPPDRSPDEVLEAGPIPARLEGSAAGTNSPLGDAETHAQRQAGVAEHAHRAGFTWPPFKLFTAQHAGGAGARGRAGVTRAEWFALAALSLWLVVNVFALAWVRSL